MSRSLIFQFFGFALLAALACIAPWLTTLAFIRTEHSSELGLDGASFWHSGLPLRFLTRSDLTVGETLDSFSYWCDAFFWFVAFLLVAASIRFLFRRGHSPPAA